MNEEYPEYDEEYTEPLSRSEKKRRSTALQRIGEALGKMPVSALKTFNLPDDVYEALVAFSAMRAHEAKRRQMQYIGKLMRDVDYAAIEERLAQIQEGRAAAAADFHHLERMRDRLMNNDSTVFSDILETYPQIDMQHLRQLVRNARKEREKQKPPKAYRVLFRYLRDVDEQTT